MAVTRLQPPVAAEGEVDQLDVMHGDVGAGVAAGDPLGELAAADRLRLQQRAVAVVDVLAARRRRQRAQLLVIGVEQLVIDDLGQHALLAGRARRARPVPASVSTDGFSISTCLPASSACLARLEVAIVGRGDADDIDAAREQLVDRVRRRRSSRRRRSAGRRSLVALGPRCRCGWRRRPARTSTTPKSRSIQPVAMTLLEERAIGLVEDHPQADHATTNGW